MDYYNEFDKYPAQWLRNLQAAGHIPQGQVDERSIADVRSEELTGFRSAHFFAGVGGWPLALKLAGFPESEPVWTGSCPCQPFSVAGARKGEKDKRHLWPEFFRLIGERRPPIVFGEQVASADGRNWLAGVRADLEGLGYAVGGADLCAAGAGEEGEGWFLRGGSVHLERTLIGAPHIRQRLYWVAYAKDSNWRPRVCGAEEGTRAEGLGRRGPSGRGPDGRLADPGRRNEHILKPGSSHGEDREDQGAPEERERSGSPVGNSRTSGGMADAASGLSSDGRLQRGGEHGFLQENGRPGEWPPRAVGSGQDGGVVNSVSQGRQTSESEVLQGARRREEGGAIGKPGRPSGYWRSFDVLPCRDGKARRVEPGTFPLAHGIPARVGKLRAYGNAIVPEAAATFIEAVLDVLSPR